MKSIYTFLLNLELHMARSPKVRTSYGSEPKIHKKIVMSQVMSHRLDYLINIMLCFQ